jgi:hypothetical protein
MSPVTWASKCWVSQTTRNKFSNTALRSKVSLGGCEVKRIPHRPVEIPHFVNEIKSANAQRVGEKPLVVCKLMSERPLYI